MSVHYRFRVERRGDGRYRAAVDKTDPAWFYWALLPILHWFAEWEVVVDQVTGRSEFSTCTEALAQIDSYRARRAAEGWRPHRCPHLTGSAASRALLRLCGAGRVTPPCCKRSEPTA